MIYIYKNNQQSGPYEEHIVLDQLKAGMLSPDDMGIRHGDTQWKPLRAMFPDAVASSPVIPPPPVPAPNFIADVPKKAVPTAVVPEPQYRATLIPKIFFGLCLLGAIVGFAAAAYYFYSLLGSSGNLETDLGRLSYRILARNLAAGMLVGGFFTFLAFLISFKRRIIRSNGLRVGLRVVFILVLLAGLGSIAFGAISYLTYSGASSSTPTNELSRALEEGAAAVGPFEMAVIALPIGAGLFLFGLSGILATKRGRD